MNIKQITSQINAVKARLSQIQDSTYFSESEKAKLAHQCEAELAALEQQKNQLESNCVQPEE